MARMILGVLALVVSLVPSGAVAQQDDDEAPPRALVVGVRIAPPFVMQREDGSFRGLAIDLLEDVAADVGFTYDIRAYDLAGLIDATESGEVDLAASALTITAERESRVDFTHPFYTAGLAIAVRDDGGVAWLSLLAGLLRPAFLSAIGALVAVLFLTGALMWLAERRKNEEQFGGAGGLGHGFWWSAVTMTTVGYGDKAPITIPGRLIALVWMFTSVIIISGFTAAIATSLTLSSLGSGIEGASDLRGRAVGALGASTSEQSLRSLGARVRTFDSGEAALAALAAGDIEAVVHDEPVLRWWISNAGADLAIVSETFGPQDYGFATPSGSPLRESVSRAVLGVTSRPDWHERVRRVLSGG